MSDNALAAILDDAKAGERRLRERRMRALSKGRDHQLDNLWTAWDQRWPEMIKDCPELGRPPTQEEHFTIWAGRLKGWGQSVHACGCRARNALKRWQPPTDLDPEELRLAKLAHFIAVRALDPNIGVPDIEQDLRRTCTETSAHLLATLYLPSGWLGRIQQEIELAVPKRRPQVQMPTSVPKPAPRVEPASMIPTTTSLEQNPEVTADPFLATARHLAEGRVYVDLEKVDFAAILTIAKPLSTVASRLAKWEHDGLIGDAGADMLLQMGEQWPALESALAAAGMADRKTAWSVTDKRRETAARMLRDLACDLRKGSFGHDVFATRLAIAVEALEEIQAAPIRLPPINFDRLDLVAFRQKATALVTCIQDYQSLPLNTSCYVDPEGRKVPKRTPGANKVDPFEEGRARAQLAKNAFLEEAARLGLSCDRDECDLEGDPRHWYAVLNVFREVENLILDSNVLQSSKSLEEALEMLKRAYPSEPSDGAKKLSFIPGHIVFCGHTKPLQGKPWDVLHALAEAQGQVLTLRALLDKVWPECDSGEETVRSAIKVARKILRQAIALAGFEGPPNPILSVERGPNRTAWKLILP